MPNAFTQASLKKEKGKARVIVKIAGVLVEPPVKKTAHTHEGFVVFEHGQILCASTKFAHQQNLHMNRFCTHQQNLCVDKMWWTQSDTTWDCRRQRQHADLESMIRKETNDKCFNNEEENIEILQLDGKPSATGVCWRDQL